MTFKDQEVGLRTPLAVYLPSGSFTVRSPSSIRLRLPGERLDTSKVVAHTNSSSASDTMLESLETVKILEVATGLRVLLDANGPMTVGQLLWHRPIQGGLEELVAHIRIAKAVDAITLEDREQVLVRDRDGQQILASIPQLLLSADQFPEDLEMLAL